VPQTLTLPFKLEDTGSNFGDLLMGDGRPSRGLPSLKKYGKDPRRIGGDTGGPKWGSKLPITPMLR